MTRKVCHCIATLAVSTKAEGWPELAPMVFHTTRVSGSSLCGGVCACTLLYVTLTSGACTPPS